MRNRRPALATRPWVPAVTQTMVQAAAAAHRDRSPDEALGHLDALIESNRRIHGLECLNLNPATNIMSPRAEAALGAGLGTRPSLGYPGAKYEMGLEAIEEIEIIAAELAAAVFGAAYAEIRVPSGAMANLYGFMACAEPGDRIIVPPATIAGHITHHRPGAAGLYGLDVHEAPIDPARYTVDIDGLAALADRVRPRLITIGGSLNLHHHDVRGVRTVADAVGARVLFDAAHLSGPIAGGTWPNPLAEGAHLMTMSTYKSLAGPPSGILVTNEPDLARRVEEIAYPGLTANFDVGKIAALAITLVDWQAQGADHAAAMTECASTLAGAISDRGVAVHDPLGTPTRSHAFALDARAQGGGTALAHHLRRANLLSSAIGLPSGVDDGLRVGTNELVRVGVTVDEMPLVADLIARALTCDEPDVLAPEVAAFRSAFDSVRFAT